MRRFQFLLLDAGPIIKLFELDLWDSLIEKCDVTISRIVANEAKYASQEYEDISIDLEAYEEQGRIRILEVETSVVKTFYDKLDAVYKDIVHDGEKETLALLCDSPENWSVCAADKAVFRVLGLLGKAARGISLEEILTALGQSPSTLEPQYTKKYRDTWTRIGQADFIQGQGLV